MKISIESWDSPQREPPEPLPPYRDGATVVRVISGLWAWACPCGEVDDGIHLSAATAQDCLELHLESAHGETQP